MALSEEEIKLAYQLLLNRIPSAAEVSNVAERHTEITTLRDVFVRSEEYRKQYERTQKAIDGDLAPTLIHIHIPKTAGSTLSQALELEPTLRPNWISTEQEVARLLALPRQQKRQLRYIRGHFSMGLGEQLGIPFTYLSVLRNPERRVFSFFQYIGRTPSHPMHEQVVACNDNFGTFLELSANTPALRTEVDNGQIRRLSGQLNQKNLGNETELLKMAIHNALAPNMILGFAEHFDVLVERLVNESYLKSRDFENFNVSPNAHAYDEACEALSDEQKALFENFTMWDTYLYDVCHALIIPAS